MRGPALILDAVIENDLLSIRVDALKRVPGPSDLGDFHYIPILFGEGGSLAFTFCPRERYPVVVMLYVIHV